MIFQDAFNLRENSIFITGADKDIIIFFKLLVSAQFFIIHSLALAFCFKFFILCSREFVYLVLIQNASFAKFQPFNPSPVTKRKRHGCIRYLPKQSQTVEFLEKKLKSSTKIAKLCFQVCYYS